MCCCCATFPFCPGYAKATEVSSMFMKRGFFPAGTFWTIQLIQRKKIPACTSRKDFAHTLGLIWFWMWPRFWGQLFVELRWYKRNLLGGPNFEQILVTLLVPLLVQFQHPGWTKKIIFFLFFWSFLKILVVFVTCWVTQFQIEDIFNIAFFWQSASVSVGPKGSFRYFTAHLRLHRFRNDLVLGVIATTPFPSCSLLVTSGCTCDASTYFAITWADVGAFPRCLLLWCNQSCTESSDMKRLASFCFRWSAGVFGHRHLSRSSSEAPWYSLLSSARKSSMQSWSNTPRFRMYRNKYSSAASQAGYSRSWMMQAISFECFVKVIGFRRFRFFFCNVFCPNHFLFHTSQAFTYFL